MRRSTPNWDIPAHPDTVPESRSNCPESSGFAVRNPPEWVSGISRNPCPESSGISVRNPPELVSEIARNSHLAATVLRMCYWVMWKRPRTRIRNLLGLQVPIRQAVGLGRSGLGPWKCARVLGFAMSKNWLESQGLVCLADNWWRYAPLR